MQLAALILSCFSLALAIASISWQLGKHWSTHQIQMVPVDSVVGNNRPDIPISDQYQEFDQVISDPMTPEEKEYFEKHNRK